jgi:SAM-dependent methyltransferase
LQLRGFVGCATAKRILVAGCGAGHEAAAIQAHFDTRVDAVDIELNVEPDWQDVPGLVFQQASVCDLPFDDDTFDAAFYYHVVEHVDDPVASVAEIGRVMRAGGWMFVGTPNRHRLISSVGAHRQTQWEDTLFNKLKDNWQDWAARLRGRFRNEFGAHAGFSRRELDRMLSPYFDQRIWLTSEYLRFKYSQHPMRPLIAAATWPALGWLLAPSVYVLCRKAHSA